MAEWLCNGLQIRVQRFDSASGLHHPTNGIDYSPLLPLIGASVQTVDVEDMPLAYLPGNALRAGGRVCEEIARLTMG
jgi:hypothetical protein